jgi:hypothetical protein
VAVIVEPEPPDLDGDGIADDPYNYPDVYNPDQADFDEDGRRGL